MVGLTVHNSAPDQSPPPMLNDPGQVTALTSGHVMPQPLGGVSEMKEKTRKALLLQAYPSPSPAPHPPAGKEEMEQLTRGVGEGMGAHPSHAWGRGQGITHLGPWESLQALE